MYLQFSLSKQFLNLKTSEVEQDTDPDPPTFSKANPRRCEPSSRQASYNLLTCDLIQLNAKPKLISGIQCFRWKWENLYTGKGIYKDLIIQ